ncbi:MAG: hypothetical protein IPN68_16700 [Bacteroidetes bacterium]|nr:hypothetical protein [Bacteroidota bacterium]
MDPILMVGLDRSGNGDAVVMSSKGFFVKEEGVWREGLLPDKEVEEYFKSVRDSKEAMSLLNEALKAIPNIENKKPDEQSLNTNPAEDLNEEIERLLKAKAKLMEAKMKLLEVIKNRKSLKGSRI